MSFDIFYQTSRLSEQTVEAINPFTGKVMQKPVGETVTPDEREALLKLLSTRGANAEEMGGTWSTSQTGQGWNFSLMDWQTKQNSAAGWHRCEG